MFTDGTAAVQYLREWTGKTTETELGLRARLSETPDIKDIKIWLSNEKGGEFLTDKTRDDALKAGKKFKLDRVVEPRFISFLVIGNIRNIKPRSKSSSKVWMYNNDIIWRWAKDLVNLPGNLCYIDEDLAAEKAKYFTGTPMTPRLRTYIQEVGCKRLTLEWKKRGTSDMEWAKFPLPDLEKVLADNPVRWDVSNDTDELEDQIKNSPDYSAAIRDIVRAIWNDIADLPFAVESSFKEWHIMQIGGVWPSK